MADSPADWMSYADYLGLNEASLRELEASANQQRAQADDSAQGALGRSYQEAQRDVEAGGQGNLTATASYGDYLKAQRDAQQANATQGSGYEGAARAAMAAGRQQPSFSGQRDVMQRRLDQRRVDIGQGKANVSKWTADQKAQRDAQANAFEQASKTLGVRTAQEEGDLLGYAQGRGRTGGRQQDLVSRYGSVAGARNALQGRATMQGRTAFSGALPYEKDTLNRYR